MKYQILFSKKKNSKCCLLKFLPSMQSVNQSESKQSSWRDLDKITNKMGATSELLQEQGFDVIRPKSIIWFQSQQQFHDAIYRDVYHI